MIYGFRYGMGVVMGAAAGLLVVGATVAGGLTGLGMAKRYWRKRKTLSNIRIDNIDSESKESEEDIQP